MLLMKVAAKTTREVRLLRRRGGVTDSITKGTFSWATNTMRPIGSIISGASTWPNDQAYRLLPYLRAQKIETVEPMTMMLPP